MVKPAIWKNSIHLWGTNSSLYAKK